MIPYGNFKILIMDYQSVAKSQLRYIEYSLVHIKLVINRLALLKSRSSFNLVVRPFLCYSLEQLCLNLLPLQFKNNSNRSYTFSIVNIMLVYH